MPRLSIVAGLTAAAGFTVLAGATTAHAAPRTEVLFSFGGVDGGQPSDLIADPAGALYGTTWYGGVSKQCDGGCGTVFRLVPPAQDGMPWVHQTLYSFTGQADGALPSDRPVLDLEGNLYGTTIVGGDHPFTDRGHADGGCGVVWELSPPVQGDTWTYQVLYTFTGDENTDGCGPIGQLARSSAGVLYGTTHNGGTAPRPSGTAYALSPPQTEGGAWTETVLHAFEKGAGQGGTTLLLTGHETELVGLSPTDYGNNDELLYDIRLGPQPPVFGRRITSDTAIYLYGAPIIGGDHSVFYGSYRLDSEPVGDIVELSPPGNAGKTWTQTFIHAFSDPKQGSVPNGTLLRTATGTLFGTTQTSGGGGGTADGSAGGSGAVFRLDPPAAGETAWTYTELHQFDSSPGTDGGRPDGGGPNGGLVFGRHHQLYGTTDYGGRYGHGTIFMQTWH
jgi:uncharacterized repeat protein (TIGR03803 family)